MLTPSDGRFVPRGRSLKGHHSIDVFGLNRANLARGRRDAWALFQLLIVHYVELKERGEAVAAGRLRDLIRRQSFASVLIALLRFVDRDDPLLIDSACLSAIRKHPEIREWTRADKDL